jgi:hypothetical protein
MSAFSQIASDTLEQGAAAAGGILARCKSTIMVSNQVKLTFRVQLK